MNLSDTFEKWATRVAQLTGRPITFGLCCATITIWAISGPLFGFSDTWQLIVNTGTTIITFLMVFLIQNTQNRDSMAIQTKLDELILKSRADNAFVGIEELSENELQDLRRNTEKTARKRTKTRSRTTSGRTAESLADKAPRKD